jgi:hypothetical protein
MSRKRTSRERQLYELEVILIAGPVTEAFVKAHPVVSRTIEIRGDQTLETLHGAIFDAFDRDDPHMYEFQLGGTRPMDPKAKRFVLPEAADDPFSDEPPAGVVSRTRIDDLGLRKGRSLLYWFDFGDDWWHRIKVVDIRDEVPPGTYPKVTARTGESPPQYMDWDAEYEEDEEDQQEGDEE